MGKTRLEAFSDGVIAILITIMVLELKVPHGADLAALRPLMPVLLSYVLSFIYVGIYWNNHHHLLHTVKRVSAGIMWANLHLLFWLSLVPFGTGWIGENWHAGPLPTVFYGVNLFMAGIAWLILQRAIISAHGSDSTLARAVGRDLKGVLSGVAYLVAIGVSFFVPWVAWVIYAVMAVVWLIPDRRIERAVEDEPEGA